MVYRVVRLPCIVVRVGWDIGLAGGVCVGLHDFTAVYPGDRTSMRDCQNSYNQAAAGLAISRFGYLRRILLPVAAPGIAGALVLVPGAHRQNSPAVLLFTAGYVMRSPSMLIRAVRLLCIFLRLGYKCCSVVDRPQVPRRFGIAKLP